MEEGLVPFKVKYVRVGPYEVLILVVVDNGLVPSVFMGHTCEECAS